MFALVDANSFYCSAEQVYRPQWRKKPVIVLSNNDGCIVSANRLAIQAGIKKFVPYFQMKELCRQNGVIVCSSNYELYADLSAKMMQLIGQFASQQRVYSIDESFLHFADGDSRLSLSHIQQRMLLLRRTIWKELRLPVSVGVANTLTLAKAANHIAKQSIDYQGVCCLGLDNDPITLLSHMDVGSVWGIGRKTAAKLKQIKIFTALQLAQFPPKEARKRFSIDVERTIRELNGERCIEWQQVRAPKQQICSSRSMGERITDFHSLQQALCKHAGIAAAKARADGLNCAVVMAFASNSPHDIRPQRYRMQHQFVVPTNDTAIITKAVYDGCKQLYKPGVGYYKLGIGLLGLEPVLHQQFDLFAKDKSNPKLMGAYDAINHKYGTDTVFMAAQGINPKWGMRRDFLTPKYTTKWQDTPKIRC